MPWKSKCLELIAAILNNVKISDRYNNEVHLLIINYSLCEIITKSWPEVGKLAFSLLFLSAVLISLE